MPRKRREEALHKQEAFLNRVKVDRCPLPPLPSPETDCHPLLCVPCVVLLFVVGVCTAAIATTSSTSTNTIPRRTRQEYNVGIKCATITPDEQRMDGKAIKSIESTHEPIKLTHEPLHQPTNQSAISTLTKPSSMPINQAIKQSSSQSTTFNQINQLLIVYPFIKQAIKESTTSIKQSIMETIAR